MKKHIIILFSILTLVITAQAQWVNSGPEGGDLCKIKQNGNRLYLYGNRLYKSDNNGDTWEILNTPSVTFTDLLFPPGKIIAASTKGIFVSYNNGTDWVSHNTGISDSSNGVKCLGSFGSRIFAGTLSKAYYSDNEGISWSLSSPSSVGQCAGFAFINNIVLLATNTGIKRSTDNGLTYTSTSTGISGTNPNIISILVFNNEVYCRKYSAVQMNIYKSNDNGLNWQTAVGGLTGLITSVSELTSVNNNLFFATGAGTFELNSGTGNWISSTLSPIFPNKILHFNLSKYFVINNFSRLYSTIDVGLNWQNSDSNVNMKTISKFNTANNKLFGFNFFGELFVFNSTVNSWDYFSPYYYNFGGTITSITTANTYCIDYGAGNQYYLGTDGGVWSSNDNGITWLQHHAGLPITNSTFNYKTVNDLYINGNIIIAATSGGIYRSADQANSWTQVSSLSCNDINKYGSYLYATGNGVFRSNDNGLTWTAFAGATSGGPFSYITGSGGKIFTSTDINTTPGNTVYADTIATSFSSMTTNIGAAFGYGDYLFLGKFYINTSLSLTNLVDMTDNLPCYFASQALGCIETYLTRNTVYGDNLWLGTSGFSTWYRSLGDFGFPVGLKKSQTEKLEIKSYPNPANELIYFENLNTKDQIEIFNNLGQLQLITIIIDNKGIDISHLAKGFYIYAITDKQNGTRTTGKFIKE